MKPSVTISTKIRMRVGQKMSFCCGFEGLNRCRLNDPCHATTSTDKTSTTNPKLNSSRRFMKSKPCFDYMVGQTLWSARDALVPLLLFWNEFLTCQQRDVRGSSTFTEEGDESWG